MQANTDIRVSAMSHGVRHWEIAQAMGISDFTFSRKLRKELSENEKQQIFTIIDKIAAEKENAVHSATNTMNG